MILSPQIGSNNLVVHPLPVTFNFGAILIALTLILRELEFPDLSAVLQC